MPVPNFAQNQSFSYLEKINQDAFYKELLSFFRYYYQERIEIVTSNWYDLKNIKRYNK